MVLRHEINLVTGNLTIAANTDYNNISWIELDTSLYSGTLTAYLEVIYNGTSVDHKLLVTNNGSYPATVTGGSSGTNLLLRSASFTPSSVLNYAYATGAGGTGTIKVARIILIQDTGVSNLTATSGQFDIGNRETGKNNTAVAALTSPKYWKYVAANYDSTTTFYADVAFTLTGTGTCNITLQESSATLTAPTWTTKVAIVTNGTAATLDRIRSASFTPVDGRMYRIVTNNSSASGTLGLYMAKIVTVQTGTDINKTEEQYLLGNTLLVAGTALQGYLTKWDSTEWSGVTNIYKHEANASDNNTSVLEVDTAAGVQLGSSSLNAIDNIQTSSIGISMPANTNLDTKATTNSGSIYGNRIVVSVVKSIITVTKKLAMLGVG